MAEGVAPGRRVDETLLRHLQGIFRDLTGVARTSLFPPNQQESLVVAFETARYPDGIDGVRLEIRAYTNGDFHVTYLENYLGSRRYCRWDRHDQPHNSRDHFHPLPTAGRTDAVDRQFPTDLTALLREQVLPWVDERVGVLWDDLG